MDITGPMVTEARLSKHRLSLRSSTFRFAALGVLAGLSVFQGTASAAQWSVSPTLTLAETYTDNVTGVDTGAGRVCD